MLILGIETSCDETSAAVVEDGRTIRSSVVASQADLHARWGGVVPEVASRMHVERMLPVVIEALRDADATPEELHGLAVTNRPGLIGALVVGVACAKALALSWSKPLVGVHHVVGHLYAPSLAEPMLAFPYICLVVSGGHTELVLVEGHGDYSVLGRTRDDAAGECFDKCARLMGLPYPGGPSIENAARTGDPRAAAFPRAWLGDTLDFSFSGLKTAVARFMKREGGSARLEDVAASFQASVVEVLVKKTIAAAKVTGVTQVAAGGGVAANSCLALTLKAACADNRLKCVVPPRELCTDNAAMVAAAGYPRLRNGDADGLGLDTVASDNLPRWQRV